jgi:predicted MPP superfamily phosphohydrolase
MSEPRPPHLSGLAWATDVHLNFLTDHDLMAFCASVAELRPDALVLTGDIAEAPNLGRLLGRVASALERPIYFVLGNHDFYHGSIAEVPALERYPLVIVATHVPPFKEACWHEGKLSNDDWLPFFTCKSVGDVLLEAARGKPDHRLEVLCGHTHGAGVAELAPNLIVRTGGAEYGRPELQGVFDLDAEKGVWKSRAPSPPAASW